jgi:hypothetical protein
MRGACTESPASGGIPPGLISCKHLHVIFYTILGEGRAVPPVYPRASEGTPSFIQLAILAKKYFSVTNFWTLLKA